MVRQASGSLCHELLNQIRRWRSVMQPPAERRRRGGCEHPAAVPGVFNVGWMGQMTSAFQIAYYILLFTSKPEKKLYVPIVG